MHSAVSGLLCFTMGKTILLGFLAFVLGNTAVAQNLVRNPSFEEYYKCPGGSASFEQNVKDWTDIGGAIYFNACAGYGYGLGVPLNISGFQYAKTGKAYAGIRVYFDDITFDWRNYIENHLLQPLTRDSIYCVYFYASLIGIKYGAIQNIDAYLSDTLVYSTLPIGSTSTLFLPAQIKSDHIISDTLNWTLVSGLYKAKGGEQYITIGNFTSRKNTIKLPNIPTLDVAYYIDDVNVSKAGMGLKAPDLGADTAICRSVLPIHLTAPQGYDAYQWSNGATTRLTEATDQGKYWVKCIMNGCGELYDEKIISFDTPLLNLDADKIICKGESVSLEAKAGFDHYLWSTGDTTQSLTVTSAGIYALQTTDRCGQQTDTIRVMVDTVPTGIISLGNDTTLCRFGTDTPVELTANTTLPNYAWNTGDTTRQIIVTERGMYTLQSQFRCGTVSDSIFVDECPPKIFFPNAFTPDNDGKNSVFRAVVVNTTVNRMIIYNRWGQEIYESTNPFPEWDGTFNNQKAPGGLYVYLVFYSDDVSGSEQKQQRGVVMLVR